MSAPDTSGWGEPELRSEIHRLRLREAKAKKKYDQAREEAVLRVAKDLEAKLPPDYKDELIKASMRALGGLGRPLNVFLRQEVDRLQLVISLVRTTLLT